MASRPLLRVPVPPGPEGVERLWPALQAALDGSGPAIAPVPTISATVSGDYVSLLLAAVRPDEPLEDDAAAAVLTTSGSTGAPHGVLLSAEQLTAVSAAANGGARPVWVAALPVTSMGGFNVLVRAVEAGRAPLPVSSIGGAGPFTPDAFADAVDRAAAAGPADDVRTSLVPAQLSRLLGDERGVDALRRCAGILVGGAATRPALLEQAAALGIALTTTYGATETAGGCVYGGRPLPGVRIDADAAPGEAGRLSITGPNVALGYRLDPALTRECFSGRTFRTADIGIVHDDGRISVLGRADDIVVVRGVNVSPQAVENAAGECAGVRACAVVVAERGGEPALHAFVEGDVDPDAVQEAIVRRLGHAAQPMVHRVDALPHLPNGKVDRRALQLRAEQGGG